MACIEVLTEPFQPGLYLQIQAIHRAGFPKLKHRLDYCIDPVGLVFDNVGKFPALVVDGWGLREQLARVTDSFQGVANFVCDCGR